MVHFNRHSNNEESNKTLFLESFYLEVFQADLSLCAKQILVGVGGLYRRSPSAEVKACTAQGVEGRGRLCD